MSFERNKEIARLYGTGLSMDKIGQQYGITRERVRQILVRLGVERRSAAEYARSDEARARAREVGLRLMGHLKGKILVPELEEAARLVRNGASYNDAAKRLGLSRNQVAGICHRLGIKSKERPQKFGHGRAACDWPTTLSDAKSRGLCAAQLAREIGVSPGSVRHACERYGIDLPDGVIGVSPKVRAERAA
jgi:DNA-binding CsgD family transcriptional regulator